MAATKVFVVEEITQPTHHKSVKRARVYGEATPQRFKEAVTYCFNHSSRTGRGMVIYLAQRVSLRKAERTAKLFQAKRNKGGEMFSTFHHPVGEVWRRRAKVTAFFEKAPGMGYSSQI